MSGATKWGGEFLINTTTVNDQEYPLIKGLADGRFVAMWTDESHTSGDLSWDDVRGQLFNADGSKAGAEFLVNTTTSGFQNDVDVTALPDGRFAAVWTDMSKTGGDQSAGAVRMQLFNPDGSKSGAELLVNTATDNY